MAGAFLIIDVTTAELSHRLRTLATRAENLEPFFEDVGEYMLRKTRKRFDDQTAPDGTPWAELKPATIERKRKKGRPNPELKLIDSGDLRGQINKQADRNGVTVGTPRIYGATQQFGAERGSFGTSAKGRPIPWGDVPARPFFGVDREDEREFVDILGDFFSF